ncbi:Protein phosphatase 2C 2 [Paraconiothyrium brasiliense]|uniref:protein-serine/threonine phosphatase n=1 Tax=Paraconiothyrium brasiliense TaxID=300254 RepID=A0ABR3S8L9_9PLEO
MEDAHACILDLQALSDEGKPTPADKRLSFFGVYDGHGGDKVAIYTGEHLHEIVAKQEAFKEGDVKKALQDGFLATDRAILSDPKYEEEVSGCTASVGIISKDKIYVANSGDSRSVLGIKGRAKPLSYDHKPQNEAEKARIQAAGGFVDFGRVNGNLALSRAIGDFEFKKSAELPPEQQIVTAYPDVEIHDISDDDEFLVIACDGIWDCQSSQAVIEFVRRGIVAKQDLASICENMMDNCLASNSDTGGVGCDNMTMIVIGLLRGRTKEQCPDDIDMDLDGRFQGNRGLSGGGGRIILLGDGTEITTEAADADMFDNDDEDKDRDFQVDRSNGSAQNAREQTPGPQSSSAKETTESPSSVKTEKSDEPSAVKKDTTVPEKLTDVSEK